MSDCPGLEASDPTALPECRGNTGRGEVARGASTSPLECAGRLLPAGRKSPPCCASAPACLKFFTCSLRVKVAVKVASPRAYTREMLVPAFPSIFRFATSSDPPTCSPSTTSTTSPTLIPPVAAGPAPRSAVSAKQSNMRIGGGLRSQIAETYRLLPGQTHTGHLACRTHAHTHTDTHAQTHIRRQQRASAPPGKCEPAPIQTCRQLEGTYR